MFHRQVRSIEEFDYEWYTFNTACQGPDESLDDFATRLQKLVAYCEFAKFNNKESNRITYHQRELLHGIEKKILKETYTLNKILTMARTDARASSHVINMESGRQQMLEQVHSMVGGSNKHDKQALPPSRSEKTCYWCGLAYPHVGASLAMGQTCRKCNIGNHFASVYRVAFTQPDRGQSSRPKTNARNHPRYMDTCNCSSSTDSDATSVREGNERLNLMIGGAATARQSEHIQLVNKKDIKKTATVDLRVGSHAARFVLDSGATCIFLCASE
ncbi:hypothetical protein NDU88_008711 [Pleurodeles waltl]|uniref:Uncharacterized protein n=1 Tax=Pleurodeles waltl TaxID=8319 RepID=A0AAV7RU16_PLEWA|nr:hypothetical protein NDU88_008711 [Pleurodeles waltl]